MDPEAAVFLFVWGSSGTDGTISCLASYLVCNTLFSGVINHAGGVNVSTK